MFLMNGESFVILTPTNPLLIFPKMNLLQKSCGYHVYFVISCKKDGSLYPQLGMFSSHFLNSMLFIFANMFQV
jgi:hypothetical protein